MSSIRKRRRNSSFENNDKPKMIPKFLKYSLLGLGIYSLSAIGFNVYENISNNSENKEKEPQQIVEEVEIEQLPQIEPIKETAINVTETDVKDGGQTLKENPNISVFPITRIMAEYSSKSKPVPIRTVRENTEFAVPYEDNTYLEQTGFLRDYATMSKPTPKISYEEMQIRVEEKRQAEIERERQRVLRFGESILETVLLEKPPNINPIYLTNHEKVGDPRDEEPYEFNTETNGYMNSIMIDGEVYPIPSIKPNMPREYLEEMIEKLQRVHIHIEDEMNVDLDKSFIFVNDRQVAYLYTEEPESNFETYLISMGANGLGVKYKSMKTPPGIFQIGDIVDKDKNGDLIPIGGVIKYRMYLERSMEEETGALMTTRLLVLEGMEDANRNMSTRGIYAHGTNRGNVLGINASSGCIRFDNHDIKKIVDNKEIISGDYGIIIRSLEDVRF